MSDNYQIRRNDHDKIAIPYLQERLRKFGLSTIPHGIEIHDSRLQKILMSSGRQDSTALRDRYKPDLYIIPDDIMSQVRPILCEVKSENRGHKNFSIEFDSFCSGKLWDSGNKSVMYAFVKMEQDEPIDILCCWLDEVKISYVNIPRRYDFDKNIAELPSLYPGIEFKPIEHRAGAGTPFFVVRGDSAYLQPFDKFIPKLLGIGDPQGERSRESILISIGQAHLNPGMSLHKVNQILAEYDMSFSRDSLNRTEHWDRLTTEQLREIESKLT